MLRIGLTGGIGSGKSTVANLFAHYGVSVIDADVIARQFMQNHAVLALIIEHFGDAILDASGYLQRKKLREIIFQDEKERLWLENLLHPMIRQEIRHQIDKIISPYCIIVIPLLAETKHNDFIDRVLVIDVKEELQLQRAKDRDAASEEDIKAILASQCQRQQRLAIADDIIENNGSLEELSDAVARLHQQYLVTNEPII